MKRKQMLILLPILLSVALVTEAPRSVSEEVCGVVRPFAADPSMPVPVILREAAAIRACLRHSITSTVVDARRVPGIRNPFESDAIVSRGHRRWSRRTDPSVPCHPPGKSLSSHAWHKRPHHPRCRLLSWNPPPRKMVSQRYRLKMKHLFRRPWWSSPLRKP